MKSGETLTRPTENKKREGEKKKERKGFVPGGRKEKHFRRRRMGQIGDGALVIPHF
jgi:hypothetical protein